MKLNTNPIRVARDNKGLTQIDLSLRSKLSLSTVRNAERGLATAHTLACLARTLGVGIDVLTGRKAP